MRHAACRSPACMKHARARGFTLAEAVIVIAITGIVAAIVGVFIVRPVQGYTEAVARAQLTDVADTAMRRIARDVRLALPNSIRVSADRRTLELLLTKTGGRYLAEEDMQPSGNILRFESASCASVPANCLFDVVGRLPTDAQAIVAGDQIVVYNLGPNFSAFNADAYAGGNRATVAAVNSATNTITLAGNPFAAQSPPMKSPSMRFQVVTTPVTYHCNVSGGNALLVRYWNYPITAAQQAPAAVAAAAGVRSALLASGVQSCQFDYQGLANINSGMIGIRITMAPTAASGPVELVHQVHVDNTP